MRNYLIIIALFLVSLTQAQIMLPAYQAIQYRRNILPTITTSAVTSIASTTAVSGGTIISDGGSAVTVSGVCWSTTSGPTIALATKTTDGLAIGTFISSLSGLNPNTTYYVVAYATNGVGTAYGTEVSFRTSCLSCAILSDIDGNAYDTMTFGGSCWMQENLNVSKYTDGTPIPQVTDINAWNNLTTGAWCYYNNDPVNGAVYGKLYNWYAVAGIYDAASYTNPALRKKLAPTGWHVPSWSEWWNAAVVWYGGGYFVSGGRMKESGTIHWLDPNSNATNSTCFSGLPGGHRRGDGYLNSSGFQRITEYGVWWSSSIASLNNPNPEDYAQAYFLTNTSNGFNSSSAFDLSKNGFSIRCMKD